MIETIRVLLVEDNPADAELLRDVLHEVHDPKLEFQMVVTLAAALRTATSTPLELVLLDLSLPDAQDLQALSALRRAAPHLPIVVLTGRDDEATALKSVQEGAQDYLIKGHLDAQLLVRAFRYAIERTRSEEMARKLAAAQASREEAERQIERYRRELASMRVAVEGRREPDAPAPPPREGGACADLYGRYGHLLDQAFSQQMYKVDHDLTASARELAGTLFERQAGPQDVVEMHGRELDRRTDRDNWVRSRAYVEVGRLVLIRVLVQLLALYRDRALGCGAGNPSS